MTSVCSSSFSENLDSVVTGWMDSTEGGESVCSAKTEGAGRKSFVRKSIAAMSKAPKYLSIYTLNHSSSSTWFISLLNSAGSLKEVFATIKLSGISAKNLETRLEFLR